MRIILKEVSPSDTDKILFQIEGIKKLIDSEEKLVEVTRTLFEKVCGFYA